ncbi:MMPL family transporter [Geodermatophilaceae bacterium NBWT11]|nr:MMPL family transporter [Geodermatophilaceae bacterium NBWT11]
MARLLYRLGAGAHRRRRLVLALWLVVLALGGIGAVTLSGPTSDTFTISGQESSDALAVIERDFGSAAGSGASAQVVVQAPDGQTLTTGENAATVTTLVDSLGGLTGVTSATNPLDAANPTVNADQTTGYSTVTYSTAPEDVTPEQKDQLLDAVDTARDAGLTVEIDGTAYSAEPHTPIGEVVGVVLALVVLTFTFGSLLVAGMNLVTALVGVGVGVVGITIASGFTDLSSTTSVLAIMLGLAVGIDYALFIITRFRQELRRTGDVATSVATAVGTAGSAVVVAGLTVVIALAGLSVVGISFLTEMGLGAAFTIVVAVLVSLTLVPAVLGFLGRRALPVKERAAFDHADSGSLTGTPTETDPIDTSAATSTGRLDRWVHTTTRHRVPTLVVGVAALGVLAIPALSMQTTLVVSPEDGTTQAAAQDLLADGFGPGFNGPLTVLFTGADAAAALTEISPAVTALDDVVTVTAPVPDATGDAALMTIIPASGPTSEATEQLVGDVRALFDSSTSGVETYVTGTTAVSVDVSAGLDDALPVYLALVVGLAFVLLVLVFRSLLVPLVGVLGFLLTVIAALGATVAVFQWGWLAGLIGLSTTGPIVAIAPILMIGILFGLAMDYQVFLVSRMHEAHGRGSSALEAVHLGFKGAASVVVAAAAIMFAVFAGFIPGGEAVIKSIGFALAIGVLIDAFVVRLVLVPAALALLGERAWWLPRWLQWLPHLDVEGTSVADTPAAASDDHDAEHPAVPAGV